MTRSQPTLAGAGFEKYTQVTRRAQFLAEMDRVVPWLQRCARIEPIYPEAGKRPARVEHSIGVIKRVFGFTHVCYRGLAKNLLLQEA